MSKAGRPKKGSAGLPEWFDIEKYRHVVGHGAAEWAEQLAFRAVLEDFIAPDAPWPCGAEWMALIKGDPNITLARVEAACAEEPPAGPQRDVARASKIYIISHMTVSSQYGVGVRPMTCGEIEHAYQVNNFHNCLMAGFKKSGQPDDADIEKEWADQSNELYEGNGYGKNSAIKYLRVDVSLPAALLKHDFAEYIKSQSKDAKELQSPFFKSQDFLAWYNSGVLPYLDLRLWEIETGQTYRWASFVDALAEIIDGEIGSEDACRKVAKSLAKKLLDERTIRILKFQAAKEQSSSRKKSGKLFVK